MKKALIGIAWLSLLIPLMVIVYCCILWEDPKRCYRELHDFWHDFNWKLFVEALKDINA